MPTPDRRHSTLTKTRAAGIRTTHVVVALVIPLVAYFGFAAGQRALDVYRLNQEAAQVAAETESLREENARLLGQIEYLKSDAYVEKVAREQLNLVKPGDKAVVVLSPEHPSKGGGRTPAAPDEASDKPNWLRWWDFLFGPRR